MKRLALLFVLIVFSFLGIAQKATNNVTGNWEDPGPTPPIVWSDGIVPPILNIPSTNVNYDIYGTISVGSFGSTTSMTFQGVNSAYDFTVHGNLIVYGDMTFANKAMNLIIPAGGLVIVLGALSSTNKITLNNGGILVVKGATSFGGSSSDYVDSGGSFFPIGGVSGDPDATAAAAATGPFTNAAPNIQAFVNSNGSGTLPVEVLFFKENSAAGKVNLSWATSSELNFDYFEIERSEDAKEFRGIGKIAGHGTSNIRHDYALVDEKPLIGKNYYRLKTVDVDGYTEYFKVLAVDFQSEKKFVIVPNPSDGASLGFSLNFTPHVNSTVIILDNLSNIIGVYPPSNYTQTISFSSPLKSGIYYAKIVSDGFVKVERFVVR